MRSVLDAATSLNRRGMRCDAPNAGTLKNVKLRWTTGKKKYSEKRETRQSENQSAKENGKRT
jgi:hypothetical protein